MENKMGVLSKEYVLEQGIDFDEELWFTSYSDEVLDNPEDEDGKPFTGLAYELYENGNLAYYCYYKNGFKEGNYVKFHHNGKLKSIDYMIKGQTRGIRKIWYESEELKYEGTFKFGVCLKYTEWDKQGNIIRQKVAPTKEELGLITRLSDCDDNE
ncbi:hypothetical protein F3I02_30800 [Bacillus sp. SRB3LM]|nr:hypothetical protein [Bacillus sp. SRB3LM]